MTSDSDRVFVGDSAQPEAMSAQKADDKGSEFSAQPGVMETIEKSVQPMTVEPLSHPDGAGASTQPESMPLTTQQATPPPADED